MKPFTVVGIAAALALSACKTPHADRSLDRATELPPGNSVEVRVADVLSAPLKYEGREVSVVSRIDKILGPHAFTLKEEASLPGALQNELLVIGRKTSGVSTTDEWKGERVRATGMVGRWEVMDIEREVGWQLGPEIVLERERAGVVLVADMVERLGD